MSGQENTTCELLWSCSHFKTPVTVRVSQLSSLFADGEQGWPCEDDHLETWETPSILRWVSPCPQELSHLNKCNLSSHTIPHVFNLDAKISQSSSLKLSFPHANWGCAKALFLTLSPGRGQKTVMARAESLGKDKALSTFTVLPFTSKRLRISSVMF